MFPISSLLDWDHVHLGRRGKSDYLSQLRMSWNTNVAEDRRIPRIQFRTARERTHSTRFSPSLMWFCTSVSVLPFRLIPHVNTHDLKAPAKPFLRHLFPPTCIVHFNIRWYIIIILVCPGFNFIIVP